MKAQPVKEIKKKLWLIFKASPAEKRHALVGPPAIWQLERDFQIRFLLSVGLQPNHYLLDVGCGTLRGGVPLIAYLENKHYYGVDIRKNVLKEAAQELKEHNLTQKKPILIWTSNIRTLKIPLKFDTIWMFDLLYILTDEKLSDVLEFVRKHLKSNGAAYGNAMIGERIDKRWKYGFPLIQRETSSYTVAAKAKGLIAHDMGTIESLGLGTGQIKHDKKHMLRFTASETKPVLPSEN